MGIMARIVKASVSMAVVVSVVRGNSVSDSPASSTGISCALQCSNGGYCARVEGTLEELARHVQSGHLIEKCVCPTGFSGLTCQAVDDQCIMPEQKCHSGLPCSQNVHGDWGCDCSLADSMSAFAGFQCRKPYTEYCSGKYDPNAALSFCTNGGRCESDFLAAEVAPGDTSFNQAYQHRGCRCPPEFYGDHCELIKFQRGDEDTQEVPLNTNSARSPATAIILALTSLSLLLVGSLIRRKFKARIPGEITIESSTALTWNNRYIESRFNGRHRSCTGPNLHIQTVFEDGEFA